MARGMLKLLEVGDRDMKKFMILEEKGHIVISDRQDIFWASWDIGYIRNIVKKM